MNAILNKLSRVVADAAGPIQPVLTGTVHRYDGLILECAGFPASPGTLCHIDTEDGRGVHGEVVGFSDGRNLLFLDEPGAQIAVGAQVKRVGDGHTACVGDSLLGRVIDAEGAPLDGLPEPECEDHWPLAGIPQNPLARTPVDNKLDVGVRILNAALSIGQGQRVGIIAGSGVGKSVLIEMMTHNTDADVVVVGLIGERAREVGAFVGNIMKGDTASKTCVVAVPADRSPLLRMRAAHRATAIAEYFRSKGKQVMLIMDSLTRVAHARREIGLALGEQPTAKGYPPSVVSIIPSLIERTGPGLPGEGSITAFYTVLADGDDTTNDPVVDTARAILDGHLVLSRQQAQMGIYPAIDVTQSVSRVMNDIVDDAHERAAVRLRRLISLYMENRDMMLMGAYTPGQDVDLDEAVTLWPKIVALITQSRNDKASFDQSRAALLDLMGLKP